MSVKEVVVIGGVAAGASFAARARRLNEQVHITVLERGPDVSFANCGLPYFIGGEIQEREALAVQTPASLKALLNIDVKVQMQAMEIDRANKRVRVKNLREQTESWMPYDRLMLAPGARPRRLNVPGMDLPNIYTLRNLDDMDAIRAAVKSGMQVVVVGAGFIGLEMAEQLVGCGAQVSIVQKGQHVLSAVDAQIAAPLETVLQAHGVKLHCDCEVTKFEQQGSQIQCTLTNAEVLTADVVLVSVGIEPESELAKAAGLTVAQSGHIVVNNFMQTDDPAIYAAGDVIQTKSLIDGAGVAIAMGGLANRQGRVAADHIFLTDKAKPYPGSLGTAIVRVFELSAAMVGYNQVQLTAKKIPYGVTTVTGGDHAGYYPGAKPIVLRILWHRETGVLLGAQAVGEVGIDKRMDVIATAMTGGLTIDDLCHLEFAYAPPFNSAKDVINIAGFQACNERDGLVKVVQSLPGANDNVQIVDVRGPAMAKNNPVPNAINIPMPTLRDNLDKLDKSKPVVTVCVIGKNSYFGARVLSQNGFDCSSLSGGFSTQLKKK